MLLFLSRERIAKVIGVARCHVSSWWGTKWFQTAIGTLRARIRPQITKIRAYQSRNSLSLRYRRNSAPSSDPNDTVALRLAEMAYGS
jgi:hypothetical protein